MNRSVNWRSPVLPVLLVLAVVLIWLARGAFNGPDDQFASFPSVADRLVHETDVQTFLGREEAARCERSDDGRRQQVETCLWGAPEASQLTVAVIRHAAEATAIKEFRRPIVPPNIEIPGLGDEGARSAESAAEPEVLFRRGYIVVSIWYVVADGDPSERMPGMVSLARAIDNRLDSFVA
ncbi:hypothetical protein D7147_08500 [Micromonospora musae]|uniref:Uncharacterized protein n=1 Tax=Micromonospora musae TaxID=1894970 RepID=A0A3A9Y4D5_9ACTN|nr:hypothetical protein [Micromonospora musae]RKN20856.1 hypothetical protein D7147_08500 [Micromonospora musae]RKN32331.1 hypothetical protein D7044_13840 [Micromonospora musae]